MFWKGMMLLIVLGLSVVSCAPGTSPTPAPTVAPSKPTEAAKPSPVTSTAPAASETPKPATLKFGGVQSVSEAGVYVAIEKGYFKEQGITLEVETFKSGTEAIAPLSTGQIDAYSGGMTVAFLVAADRGIPLKIVAGENQYQPNWENAWVILRKDLAESGAVKTAADLKGMKVAATTPSSFGEMMMQLLIEQGGLKEGEVEIVFLPFAEQVAALGNKSIAAGWSIEPFITRGLQEGFLVKWIPTSRFFGGKAQGAYITFGPALANNHELARRWMIAYLKGTRDYMKAFTTKEGRQEVINILVKYTTVKDPKLYDAMEMSYLDPNGMLDQKSMDAQYKWFVDKGLYTGKKTFNDMTDLSFVDYAVQKLGKQ